MAVEATVQNGSLNEDGSLKEDGSPGEETQEQAHEEVTEDTDLTIIANRSELSATTAHNDTEEIYKLGFTLDDLYKLSLDFYKKEKEELTLNYFDKVQLVALWKQITSGRFSQSKCPEVGYFDVIGNDRRKAWEALDDMTADVAKQQFCELLEENCTLYINFVNEKRAEIDAELERKRLEEEERIRLEREEEERKRKEEEERIRLEEEERIRLEEEERIRLEEEEKARLALEAEEKRLQEEKEEEQRRLQKEEEEKAATALAAEENKIEATVSEEADVSNDADEQVEDVNPDSDEAPSPDVVVSQVNGEATSSKEIAPASLWTRPKLQEFISHVKRDASSVLVVGRGETVTVSVPTHALGSCLFWEFATESYDVGFGVYFEWSKSKSSVISVNVNESDSDDATAESKNEQQIIINENEDNIEVVNKPNTDEVLPVLRRNSHENVIVGSHMYPGDGIYLLKFDNSYSLLRSKTLYYRVYYTK